MIVDKGFVTQIEQALSTPTVSLPSLPSMRPSPMVEVASPPRSATVPAGETGRLGTAVAVVAALVCGALGLVVTPALLGPAAILGGFAGEHLGRSGTRKLVPAVILGATVACLVAAIILF